MNVLINASSGLGNIILFLPAFYYFKQNNPRTKFYILLDNRWINDKFIKSLFNKNNDCEFLEFNKNFFKIVLLRNKIKKIKPKLAVNIYSGNRIKDSLKIMFLSNKFYRIPKTN